VVAHTEKLGPGDSILYDSGTPHGMIAVGGSECTFIALVLSGEAELKKDQAQSIVRAMKRETLLAEKFVKCVEDENGVLQKISFENADKYNFAFDIVDELGTTKPDKLAMLHISEDMTERRFTFQDMKKESARAANYFKSLGIKAGDRVMLVLKRHYQFWFAMLGLHKLGAVAIPAPISCWRRILPTALWQARSRPSSAPPTAMWPRLWMPPRQSAPMWYIRSW